MKIECCICLEDLSANDDTKIKAPKCGHLFHENCINLWLETNASCPQCRVAVNRKTMISVHLTSTVASSRRSSILNSSICENYRELNDNLLAQQEENRKEIVNLDRKVNELLEEKQRLIDEIRQLKTESVVERITHLMVENKALKKEIAGCSKSGSQEKPKLIRHQSADAYKNVQSIVAKSWKKN